MIDLCRSFLGWMWKVKIMEDAVLRRGNKFFTAETLRSRRSAELGLMVRKINRKERREHKAE